MVNRRRDKERVIREKPAVHHTNEREEIG